MTAAETAAALLFANFSIKYRSSQNTSKSDDENRIWLKRIRDEDRLESHVPILQGQKGITRVEISDQSIQREEDIRLPILEKIKLNSNLISMRNVFNYHKSPYRLPGVIRELDGPIYA